MVPGFVGVGACGGHWRSFFLDSCLWGGGGGFFRSLMLQH